MSALPVCLSKATIYLINPSWQCSYIGNEQCHHSKSCYTFEWDRISTSMHNCHTFNETVTVLDSYKPLCTIVNVLTHLHYGSKAAYNPRDVTLLPAYRFKTIFQNEEDEEAAIMNSKSGSPPVTCLVKT